MTDVATPTTPARAAIAARAAQARARRRALIISAQIAIAVLLLAGMYALNGAQGNLVMPRPDAVARQFVAMTLDGTIPRALGQTLTVLVAGFVISAVTGVLGGIILGGFPTIGRVMEPFVNAINVTPSAAFIPLLIAWFSLYTEAKIALVWLAAFFPILLNTTSGIANANKDLTEMAQAFGARRRALFWSVMVPDALPSILTGLRIGVAISTIGTVIAELTMAQSGLGGLLTAAGNRFQMDRYFAVVVVLMALGILITSGIRRVERHFGRWRISQAEGR
ncbi:ABC transporter permease [Ketogulonicigenium vulgare]|uniref:ABC transporter, inner membrane subunit n=1 Tax=Ketogulonicigenium vulgare (strain WSH-001) TaxID=759362 RepID=F9Y5J7_KETVW|nr:ABC transporter permease [Ketogulonicigenium vulgare]ADO42555.1 ABC transporter, inner membrane subunit [Ketogulonicigenium vulgare Y25]AEM40750.1 ABC transporter, inner membrane subunit [Ketogulonicigenium vulgare WSH-001]ALJ80919.1 ABC transporter permease [Ketogulonicigenium vulgare]ANW33690.1 ABC transporter permease [Ketogulonicigenium vulgare]AOZ54468.1 ABC transporter inner membrane protein [Ketogulonicigenium vulgare]